LLEKLGGDSLAEMLPRFSALRNNRLSDLQIETREHIFWSDLQSPDV
jgi:chorismate synthase